MYWIKTIELENACGYRRARFNLNRNLNMFYGPNGCGKSNLLYMIDILCSPSRHMGRDVSLSFRRMMFHPDYDPGYQMYSDFDYTMWVKATFTDDNGKDYVVEIEMAPDLIKQIDEASKSGTAESVRLYNSLIKKVGIVRNELPADKKEYGLKTNADNPMNLNKFQLEKEAGEKFLDIAHAVYGYDCFLEKEVEEIDKIDKHTQDILTFYTDFIITKNDDGEGFTPVDVHYRRMSDGERKIATLLKQLLTPNNFNNTDIYIVDNIEMHCYFARHVPMIEKLLEHFPNKQIIATTHSPILVGMPGVIKPYLKPEYLQDVIEVRKNSREIKRET